MRANLSRDAYKGAEDKPREKEIFQKIRLSSLLRIWEWKEREKESKEQVREEVPSSD